MLGISPLSSGPISDLGDMGYAVRRIIQEIAMIPNLVVVKFIADNTGWNPPAIEAATGGAVRLPSYDQGGIVPGPLGKPQLAIVHGGEIITPPASHTQYNTIEHNVSYNVEAHYARLQSEASIRDDLALMELMHYSG